MELLICPESKNKLLKKSASERTIFCRGLYFTARWFVVGEVSGKGMNLIVLPTREAAEYCAADLYNIIEGDCVFFLPDSGSSVQRSNYKSSLSVQRTAAVGKIVGFGDEKPAEKDENKEDRLFIVTFPEALEERIPRKRKINDCTIKIAEGDEITYESLKEQLAEKGFERTDFVALPGQYAIRGSIVDIFSFSDNNPYRISFWGNEVESIHVFDCNTQLSTGTRKEVEIISDIVSSPGEGEEEPVLITDMLPEDTLVWLDSSDMYKDGTFYPSLERFRRIFLDCPMGMDTLGAIDFGISPQPVFNKNFDLLYSDIKARMESGYTVTIFGEKASQTERLKSIIYQEAGVTPEFITGKNIHEGFIDHQSKRCCYSDHQIFDRFHRVSIRRSVEKTEQLTLNELSSFNIGDYVVHIDHGVGIFGGLVRMKDDKGRMKEAVKLIYRDNDVVFVSVHSLHKISRFRSRDGEPPKINKLGSKSWQNLKTGAKSKIKDIAKDLIQLYANRKASKGFAFSPDGYLQEELESSFMYEDTPDQESATQAVKRDMEDDSPMDRLICGDVGFGKTEVAIRAAFKAAVDGKQVAVLVPTTILALQHYTTFTSRLKDLPCTVDYVSRLRTAKEISAIKERLAKGQLDILIGTHKILGDSFIFKDLGLLIIDEEQKFGVSAKEKLRQMKKSVDTLTLSATPIPRTLQFSLLGARDLSIINTPPPNRIPIQTEIILFGEQEIKSIINYELNRGGQVFFVHNRVEELESIHDILHRLVPDMRICVAHGQMNSTQLENKMLDFINGEYDLLLCTTIIENGLDIPNANTIIINQAQNIGLSDLHQLRGRVGRSNRKAFCYLIVPPLKGITDDARRRLKAIEEFSDLGSGFNIAMQDMDIRGTGNLLGAEQSGFIMDMGYETYQKILAEAMEELGVETGMTTPAAEDKFIADCTIETDRPAYIPDSYIDIQAEKIRIYKQLDTLSSEKEINRAGNVLKDRFGPLPDETLNLLDVVKLRNTGGRLGFEKIIVKNSIMIMFFISNPMSPYYKSSVFEKVLSGVNANDRLFNLKQGEGKLKIVVHNVGPLSEALGILKKLEQ